MKNTIKMLGFIAIVAVIGFSMAACSLPEPEPETPYLPSSGTWTEGNLATASSEAWYRFSVTSGTTYYVWVKEYWSNSVVVADGYADVRLDAKYDGQIGTAIFTNSDAGANSTTSYTDPPVHSYFTATKDGTVYLRVYVDSSLFSGGPGKYKVAVTTDNVRPSGEDGTTPTDTTTPVLTAGTWTDEGTLANASSEDWYQFSVTSGTTYYIHVKDDDSLTAPDTGYADVVLDAKYSSKTGTAIFTASDAGSNSVDLTFTANQTGTVYIRVYPNTTSGFSVKYGSYRVAYTTVATRPSGEGSADRTTPVLQTTGVWTDEKILDTLQSFDWYQFSVTFGTTYYVWVRDSLTNSVGLADDYADVRLEARYLNKETGEVIFTNSDAGANSSTTPSTGAPSSFTASQSGVVYLKVSVDQTLFGKAGKYKVAVTTSNSRPTGEGTSLTALTSGVWSPERTLADASSETWHTFYASNGTTYYIHVKDDDTLTAPLTGYADVVLDAKYGSKTGTAIFTASDAGSNSGDLSFPATQSETVYIRVYPNPNPITPPVKIGSYKVAYNTTGTRPSGE